MCMIHDSSPHCSHLALVILPTSLQGETLMTYTNYPSFAPHSVLDWQSYDEPEVQVGRWMGDNATPLESATVMTALI